MSAQPSKPLDTDERQGLAIMALLVVALCVYGYLHHLHSVHQERERASNIATAQQARQQFDYQSGQDWYERSRYVFQHAQGLAPQGPPDTWCQTEYATSQYRTMPRSSSWLTGCQAALQQDAGR